MDSDPVSDDAVAFFVYPFQHDIKWNKRGRLDKLQKLLGTRWSPWISRYYRTSSNQPPEGVVRRLLDSAYFFTGNTRSFLLEDLMEVDPAEDPALWQHRARVWADREASPKRLAGPSVLRLTLRSRELKPWRQARLVYDGSDGMFDLEFRLSWGDVHLFEEGRGFIVLKIAPVLGAREGYRTLARFAGLLRTLRPSGSGAPLARLRRGDGVEVAMSTWVDEILQGLHNRGESYVDADRPDQPAGNMFSLCVFGGTLMREEVDSDRDLDSYERQALACYELASGMPASSSPNPNYLRGVMAQNGFAMWEHWRFLSLPSGGSFLCRPGTLSSLMPQFEHEYLWALLYVFFQRERLQTLAHAAFDPRASRGEALNLQSDVFSALGRFRRTRWLGQCFRDSEHESWFSVMRRGLGADEIMAKVSSELYARQQTVQSRSAREVMLLLKPLGTIVVLWVAVDVLSRFWPGPMSWIGPGLVGLGTLWWVTASWFRRK